MKKAFLITGTLLSMMLFVVLASGCANKRWSIILDSQGSDFGQEVWQTTDGGYITIATTTPTEVEKGEIYIVKVNQNGQAQWNRTFSDQDEIIGKSVKQTKDGGYIIAGYSHAWSGDRTSIYTGLRAMLLIKTDKNGQEQWSRRFTHQDVNFGWSVQPSIDGGYIIVGTTGDVYPGKTDVYLVKTDSNGNEQWSRTFGGQDNDFGYSVKQTADRGYIITGRTYSTINEKAVTHNWDSAVYLIKTDEEGQEQWSRTFAGQDQNAGYSVEQTRDSGYIIVGFTGSLMGESAVYLIKMDENGNEQWSRTFADQGNNQGYSVQQTRDGGYIMAGYTGSVSPGNTNIYLIKTDENGNEQWSRTFSGHGTADAQCVQQTKDGGYIVVGYTGFHIEDKTNVYLIKTDANGNTESLD